MESGEIVCPPSADVRKRLERNYQLNTPSSSKPMNSAVTTSQAPIIPQSKPLRAAPLMRNEDSGEEIASEPLWGEVNDRPNGPVVTEAPDAAEIAAEPQSEAKGELIAEPEPTAECRRGPMPADGECGQRIGARIDSLVSKVRGFEFEDESTWPEVDIHPAVVQHLLDQIREDFEHEASCASACCAPEVETSEAPASSAPIKRSVVAGGPPAKAFGGKAEQAPAAGLGGGSEATQLEVRFEGVRTSGSADDLAAILKALAA